jgi:site-specific DNA-methyltransferase (adenine-specific)
MKYKTGCANGGGRGAKTGLYETDNGILYNSDVLNALKQFPDESVDCVIMSPPYWGLRDYGVDGQIGLEEVYRVLKPSGTCWVNLGDTYGGSGAGTTKNVDIEKYKQNAKESYILPGGKAKSSKLRNTKYNKSLLMIPERFAIGMIERGWILRNQIIWHKPNAMPESAKDRFTVDYEYIFFFTKNKKYYFKQQFEQNKSSDKTTRNPLGRNKRCVWSINTKPFKGAHFAVFPPEIPETCIKAGSNEDNVILDIFMGAGTTAVACEKLNRRWIGVELNPDYCEIVRSRLEA